MSLSIQLTILALLNISEPLQEKNDGNVSLLLTVSLMIEADDLLNISPAIGYIKHSKWHQRNHHLPKDIHDLIQSLKLSL